MTKTNDTTFGLNEFVKRQTAEAPFSHYEGDLDELLRLAAENFDKAKPGYRDGVINIPVPAEGFFSPVVEMEEGTVLMARRPRPSLWSWTSTARMFWRRTATTRLMPSGSW